MAMFMATNIPLFIFYVHVYIIQKISENATIQRDS